MEKCLNVATLIYLEVEILLTSVGAKSLTANRLSAHSEFNFAVVYFVFHSLEGQ